MCAQDNKLCAWDNIFCAQKFMLCAQYTSNKLCHVFVIISHTHVVCTTWYTCIVGMIVQYIWKNYYMCLECYKYLSVPILNWLGELFCTLMNCFACHNDLQQKCINLQDVTFQILCNLFLFNFLNLLIANSMFIKKGKGFSPIYIQWYVNLVAIKLIPLKICQFA